MKRIACSALALLLLLSAFACAGGTNGAEKNQVVYVGSTAQYGDLEITFLEYELKPMLSGSYPRIHLMIKNNGYDRFIISADSFYVYGDGDDLYNCDSDYPWTDGCAGNCTNKRLDLHPGRSGEIWVNFARCYVDEYNIIEFDYVYSPFAKQWGKITFAITLNDYENNRTDSSESLDLDKEIIGTWSSERMARPIDADHYDYVVSISFYDDDTCWCQFKDGRSEYYSYSLIDYEANEDIEAWKIQFKDNELLNGILQRVNKDSDYSMYYGYAPTLYIQHSSLNGELKMSYQKEGSGGHGGPFWGETGG